VKLCSHLKKYRPIIPIVARLGTFYPLKSWNLLGFFCLIKLNSYKSDCYGLLSKGFCGVIIGVFYRKAR